jgi:hypothetical protein
LLVVSSRRCVSGSPQARSWSPADDQVALGDGVNIAVGATHRCHQQTAAAQAFGVANGCDGDVYRLTRFAECWQVRVNGHGGDVLELQIGAWRHGNAELGQHVHDALDGERRLTGLIARSVEADHESVTGQLVVSDAGDIGKVLDAIRIGILSGCKAQA